MNRQRRHPQRALVAGCLHLVRLLAAPPGGDEALDSSGVPTRDAKRRGAGWLPGLAAMGWRHRLGWDAGFPLMLAVNPVGVLTGCGVGPARTKEQLLADTFVALRRSPPPAWQGAGAPAQGPDLVAKGVEGGAWPTAWQQHSGAAVICPPQRHRTRPWPKRLRHWLAGIGQSVETVYDKLYQTCRLDRERPPVLGGFQARLAAKVTRHTCCFWLTGPLDRPQLAFADLMAW